MKTYHRVQNGQSSKADVRERFAYESRDCGRRFQIRRPFPNHAAVNLGHSDDRLGDIFHAVEDALERAICRGETIRARAFAETLERHRHRRARR